MKNYKFIFYIFFAHFFLNLEAKKINEIFTYQKHENIDGTDFIYLKKIKNGKKELFWLINKEEVTKEEYKEHLLKLKQKEWEDELKKEEQSEVQDEEFNNEIQKIGKKKLLKLKLKEVDEELKKIKELKDNNLIEYLAFNENSFKSQYDFENLERTLLHEIRKYLEKADDKINLFDLNNYLERIQEYPSKLKDFFKRSIKNAIERSDNTELLRKLLEIG